MDRRLVCFLFRNVLYNDHVFWRRVLVEHEIPTYFSSHILRIFFTLLFLILSQYYWRSNWTLLTEMVKKKVFSYENNKNETSHPHFVIAFFQWQKIVWIKFMRFSFSILFRILSKLDRTLLYSFFCYLNKTAKHHFKLIKKRFFS